MKPIIPALVAALALSACMFIPVPLPGPAPWQDPAAPRTGMCGAASVQQFVGQPLAVLAFPAGTRIITPGTPVTEDFSDARLNVDVDATGLVTRIWCG
ncbi:MAG: hypothetical protein IT542_04310 [Rubellimicrobium sp.]|nr:hypothetical protein [Rubellimicrobium sp.]